MHCKQRDTTLPIQYTYSIIDREYIYARRWKTFSFIHFLWTAQCAQYNIFGVAIFFFEFIFSILAKYVRVNDCASLSTRSPSSLKALLKSSLNIIGCFWCGVLCVVIAMHPIGFPNGKNVSIKYWNYLSWLYFLVYYLLEWAIMWRSYIARFISWCSHTCLHR